MSACVFLDLRLGLVQDRTVLIHGLARDEIALKQGCRALHIGFGKLRLGLIIREIGAFRRVVELDELVALLHPLPGHEIDFAHLPRDLRRHVHLLIGG